MWPAAVQAQVPALGWAPGRALGCPCAGNSTGSSRGPGPVQATTLVNMGLTVRRRGLRLYINETNLSNAARGRQTLSLYIVDVRVEI